MYAHTMSKLYVIATPIGNLEDITYRAIRILKEVDIVACEDTRHTKLLLNHYDINPPRLIACHSHNEVNSAEGIIKLLISGKDIAYVSDAGTPGISDPGARVVEAVRNADFDVIPVPGPSAVATLISVGGFIGKTFTFEGFLSPKSGRRKKRLEELLERNEAFVIYESPYRVVKILEEINLLAPTRNLIVGREMTKTFEQYISGNASEIIKKLENIKGEFAICICPERKNDNNQEA